jgi:hypothetical protein
MKPPLWGAEKDAELMRRYGFGFERLVHAIDGGRLLAVRRHPNTVRYPHQKQLIVEIDGYVWVAPYVDEGEDLFLKTMYPSRRATREYLGG